jgi:hypothetical protein
MHVLHHLLLCSYGDTGVARLRPLLPGEPLWPEIVEVVQQKKRQEEEAAAAALAAAAAIAAAAEAAAAGGGSQRASAAGAAPQVGCLTSLCLQHSDHPHNGCRSGSEILKLGGMECKGRPYLWSMFWDSYICTHPTIAGGRLVCRQSSTWSNSSSVSTSSGCSR